MPWSAYKLCCVIFCIGGPDVCGKDINDVTIAENTPHNFSMILCGKPKPSVKLFVDDTEDGSGSGNVLIDAKTHKYNYYKYFSSLSTALCNKKIKYTATGAASNPVSKNISVKVNCKYNPTYMFFPKTL